MVINQILYMSARIRTLISTICSKATYLASLSLLVISSTLAICISTSSVAHADTLGYPWPTDTEAPCYYGANGGSKCVNPADPTNQSYWYSWGVYDGGGMFHFYRNGYEYRNCTDYTQWKESTIGVSAPGTWGDGGQWYTNAPTNEQSTTAKPWDAAVVPGTIGHVAFVESVNADGTITVSEYNHDTQGHGDVRTDTPSNMGFTKYVDFGVHPTPPPARTFPDFTGDHNADLAWYENWNNGTMKVLATNQTGTGVASVNPWLVGWPKPDWAATGDFDGNGKQDVAWYTASDSTLRVLLTGTGGFSYVYTWLTNYPKPDWAAVGDFNGDGKADIAWYVASNNGTINVLTTNPSGTGVQSITAFATNYGKPDWAGVGDFTGDGKADIAWYENWNNGTMKVLKTNSTGAGVESITNWLTGWATPTWARVGDFNGHDGTKLADIAWYQSSDTTLKVLRSSGTGFSNIYSWLTGYGKPDWAGVGDFNGDGNQDIAWYENWNNGTLKVLQTNATGDGVGSITNWFSGYGTPDWAGL